MRFTFLFLLYIYSFILILPCEIQAQHRLQDSIGWIEKNPFKTNVFIENYGQFDNCVKSSVPIKYVVSNYDMIFFTNEGLIFRIEKYEKLTEDQKEKKEKDHSSKGKVLSVYMKWEGCNPDCKIFVSDTAEGYYTFGEKGYENVKAKGFKKLLYKNLYEGIDVEYTIPEKGGIKYKIFLNPGADPEKIKMLYSGDFSNIKINIQGNIVIKTPIGEITDHAPLSYYETGNKQINSNFQLKRNVVSFKLKDMDAIDNLKSIVIDPWTTTPSSFLAFNLALDLDYDKFGNVYIGGSPNKLAKYSSTGVLLWTFSTSVTNWSYPGYYSKFCLLPNSGTAFLGEGWTGPTDSTCRIVKINSNGTLNYTSQKFGTNNEIYKIIYNHCNNTLIAFGGGTFSYDNIKILSDTNLSSCVSKNFNAFGCNNNDIVSAIMDFNGDFYALSTDASPFCTAIEGHLQKSLYSANYNAPSAFDVQTSYYFGEVNYFTSSICTVRGNALALNSNYLFTYDGKTLKAWNKNSGVLLGSVIVSNSYGSGNQRTHEGIDVDECNNVYVGGTNCVHVFTFNGSNFTVQNSITTNIINEVRDLKLNKINGKIYICGLGFITELYAPFYCQGSSFSTAVNLSIDSCHGNACVNVTGGIPPYSYFWSNGSNNSCVNGLPYGDYTVTVSDNSCIQNIHIDSVSVNSLITLNITPLNPIVCKGNAISLNVTSPNSGNTYLWSNGTYGNTINVSPLINTLYTVTANNGSCIATASVSVIVKSSSNVVLNQVICQGESYQVGNHNYTISGTYTDTLLTNYGCDSIITTNLTVNPKKQIILNPIICQGDSYQFGNQILNVSGVYIDTLLTYLGCDSIIICNLTVNPQNQITINASICQGDSYHIGNQIYYTSGIYIDTISGSLGCDSVVTTNLTVNPNKQIFLNPEICHGEIFSIGAHNYSLSGNYIDTLHTFLGCDSIIYTNLKVNPIKKDTLKPIICQGEFFNVGNHLYTLSGVYIDSLFTFMGCDSLVITDLTVKPLPLVNLGSDRELCEGELVELKVDSGYTSYLWHDGSLNNTFLVKQPGKYWVKVGYNDCYESDTINFNVCKNIINIWIPNAFTPNGDGLNDVFKIETVGEIIHFQMFIFNRWGELIFETHNSKDGWNGKFKGTDVASGVYTFLIELTSKSDNQLKKYSGKVSLIR